MEYYTEQVSEDFLPTLIFHITNMESSFLPGRLHYQLLM